MTAEQWRNARFAVTSDDAARPLSGDDNRRLNPMPDGGRHLVIGLGGIGRRTIAELRRTLDRPYGSRSPKIMPMHYLAIDMEDALWSPADVPSGLTQDDGGSIFALDMASVREYSAQLPAEVREWLSRYEAATEIGSDTAANPRRLGSLLLAAKAAQLQDWLNQQAASLLDGPPGSAVQVHVVGYLAGGVGGGALTQLLVQLRRNEVMADRCHVLVYGLLPASGESTVDGAEPAAAVNTGALLTELAGAQHRRAPRLDGGEAHDLGIQRLCDEILLIAPPAETGRVARDVRTLPEALAMTIRQRMFIGGQTVAVRPSGDANVRRQIAAAAPIVLTTASDEIEEALSIALVQAALCQMIYANWRHGRGFLAEVKKGDFADYVRRAEVQASWLLTAEHLIQSAPLLDADMVDDRWKVLADDWKDANDAFLDLAQTQPRKDWLDCVTQLWNQRFTSDFRGVGVAAFYRSRQGARRDMARAIRRKLEQQLCEDWINGECGLADVVRILDAVIELQRERLDSAGDRVANTRLAEESCRVRVLAAMQKWEKLPSWGWGGAEAKTLLHAYSINLQEMYVNKVRAEGWLFAKTLLPVIIEELDGLRQLISRLITEVLQAAHNVDLLIDGLSARMEEGEVAPNFVLRLIDHDQLRQFAREVLINERAQWVNSQNARHTIARRAGTAGDFRPIVEWAEGNDWLTPIATLCREQIVGANGAWSAGVRALLDKSIYDGLHGRSGGDFGRLREISAAMIQQAESLLPETANGEMRTQLYVLLPKSSQNELFIKTIKSAFSFSRRTDISFIDTEDGSDALHLLTVTTPLAISDVELLRQMDRLYRSYVERDREYAMLALHAVGGDGEQEDVFELEDGRPAVVTAALLLIAYPLQLVVERVAADGSGRSTLWLIPRDEHGFEDTPMAIAEDILSAPQNLGPTVASLLDDNVTRALAAQGGRCERLIDAVVERVVQIRGRCNDDPLDPTYRFFVEAGKTAAGIIRSRWGEGTING